MTNEQNQTLKGLESAVQMEIDGKEYYLKASQESSNELGKKLLATLAMEEDIHRQKFEEIYNIIRDKKAWPTTDFKPDGGVRLRTIFTKLPVGTGSNTKANTTELEAVQTALNLENKTYDFYKNQSNIANYDAERDFYEAISAEEMEHRLILLDYYEYLMDPGGWFARKEHPSLDGG
jgi:rubrerythrin